ncbi:isovaleryl-CoA dehydrogenase [uncultured Ferrovibrio sp.]|jgi:putative acyl-CoA dehydrogenase|uniref:isovaleryl-CoA dehydrogenase n=1 Tax=uncultured Ferrovibrio sp. TaxID=1576913 RepID=UPI00262F64F6|nr:isovaleryl-CoA dehydrogenase [uncultured Ferrovibrio sp.]
MTAQTALTAFQTHEVFNQTPALEDYNLFTTDRALMDAAESNGAGWAKDRLSAYGAKLGSAEVIEQGRLAHKFPPQLKLFDRFGHRVDEVEFHPAWHNIMSLIIGEGLHSAPWAEPKPGAHVARAAAYIMHAQIEPGSQCPTTMTYGCVPAIKRDAAIAEIWLPKIYSRQYDGRNKPIAEKTGTLIGMGMTEKQGGSDVRANTTKAVPVGAGGPGAEYIITGHKWFFSCPQIDAHLVLAHSPNGLSCFFVPRWLPDGSKNAIHIQRLKDKVGNRSNASSEVEFHGAHGWLLGEEGRGVPTIIEMGTYTRLDCALGSAGLLRGAVAQALHHVYHRRAFQRHLIDQPLMTNVVADLAIESEAATALAMRLARAFDRAGDDAQEAAFRRLCTPAVKYWVCKRAPNAVVEAMEVLGGNGYVDEGPLGMLYKEIPLNSIWEGSGNVMCLDVLRALQKSPDVLEAFFAELAPALGSDRRLDVAIGNLKDEFADLSEIEHRARHVVEKMMTALQGALLVRHAPAAVSDAFCASRLGGDWGRAFGTLPKGIDTRAIADRARPV